MKNRLMSFVKNTVIFLVAILLSSCEEMERVGRNTDSSILYKLSQLANWSVLWLVIPLIIYLLIARDRDEMKETVVSGRTSSGKYESMFTKVPTGRIIKGDPEAARILAVLWIVCYPIGYFYLDFLKSTSIGIGNSIEFNIFVFFILIPLIILTVTGLTLHRVLTDKNNPLSKVLITFAIYIVGFCYVNMICWLVVTYILK